MDPWAVLWDGGHPIGSRYDISKDFILKEEWVAPSGDMEDASRFPGFQVSPPRYTPRHYFNKKIYLKTNTKIN